MLLLWFANIALGALVGANWLVHLPSGEEWRLLAFALPALLSTVVILTLIPGGAFLLATRWFQSPRMLGLVQGAFWTFFQVLLFVDTRIFNIFRYHFVNEQVWSLMYMRGSEDAVHIGWEIWVVIAVGLCLGTLIQAWLWRHSLVLAKRFRKRPWMKPSIVWCCVLLPAVFVEKTLYAQADLNRDRQITALAKLFPAYARVPMDGLVEDFASKVFGVEVERPPRVEIEGVALDYPLEAPVLNPDGERPNVLVIAIDCLRRDMLNPEVMPEISAWAEGDVLRFEDHASAGNSTRFGLFALLYGLYGSYWAPVLQEGRGPVLIDTLKDAGYEFGIFSSANMDYPELRPTAWSSILGSVNDSFPSEEPWRRDEQAAEACKSWLSEQSPEAPFFGFILLDSPHQTYSHPPGEEPFQPCVDEIDYIRMTDNEGPPEQLLEAVRNRYMNAVHHSDGVAMEILRALEECGLAEDTLVFVTGDHGEEFRECGFYGHTSAFTPEQIAVPLLVRGPGIEAGVEKRPTSHLDFAPTILELMGADPEMRSAWTLGGNLFDPVVDRRRVLSGWNELGLWTPEGILRVPLGLLEFDVELYDYRWNLITDDEDVLSEEAETLAELGSDCNRFLVRQPTQ